MWGATAGVLTVLVIALYLALAYRKSSGRLGLPLTIVLVVFCVAGVVQLGNMWGWPAL